MQNITTVFIREDFCQLFKWFQLFSSGEKLLKVAGHSQNRSKIDHLKWVVEGFSYFIFSPELSLIYSDSSVNNKFFFFFRGAQQYDCPHITTNSCHWKAIDGRDGFHPGMLYYMMVIVRNKKTGNETKSKLFKEDTKTLGMISLAPFSTLLFYIFMYWKCKKKKCM